MSTVCSLSTVVLEVFLLLYQRVIVLLNRNVSIYLKVVSSLSHDLVGAKLAIKSGGGSASIIVSHAMSTSCCTTTASCSQLISSHSEMPDMVNGLSKQDALWLNFQFFKALDLSSTWNGLVLQALCYIVLCEQVVDRYWHL